MSKKLQKVVSVTTSAMTILWLSGVAALAPLAAQAVTINEGDTIKTADNPDVYIAKYVGGRQYKRLILNPDVFNSYRHLSWSAIKTVTQAELDAFTTSELVRADGDYKVYKLTPNGDVGTKQWLNMTAEQFAADGYDWESIYTINMVDRDNYTTGSDVSAGGATPTPTAAAGALTVALASDTPAAGVAVENAARVPFTKINFTAGNADVTITGLTVQRTGLADDAVFASVVLIDNSDSSQVGLSQTLNALHQATFPDTITIPANTTKSYTLAGNMIAVMDAYAGQVATLSLVAVATTATVSGALPITGNYNTINATLAIGAATVSRGSLDPGTDANKAVGTTNYAFTGLKITAGSAEDMTVYSMKFNQSGSAASSDLGNVVIKEGTNSYSATVSSDGKYYTASFGAAGLVIAKGLSKEFTLYGDILSGSNRTASFDVYRDTDLVVKGNTFGYYRTVDGTSEQSSPSDGQFGSGTPFYNSYDVTIGQGSLRVDKSSTGAPAANVTEGAQGVLLGAFDFVVQGESVNISGIIIDVNLTGTGSSSDITSVTLAKADGSVLAGPNNGADTGSTQDGTVTFSGTVSFPVGTTQVLVKGNLNTDFAGDDTIVIGFNTPATRVGSTSILGATTGNSITATPATAVWGNTMTAKSGALTLSVSGTPVTQSVVRGVTGYTFANFVFDASASGEDVRVTSIALQQIVDAAANDSAVTAMQLFDGTTALNTGSNVQNPDGGATTNSYTFTLDNPLVITKGDKKTVALKGNISGTATSGGTQRWGLASGAAVAATGVSTGNDISESVTAADGQTMTIVANGQFSVALDSSTPTGKLIPANSTGNVMTVLRFKATSEQINVTRIRLALSNASSTGVDLANVYIYDGSTLLGSGTFANATGGTNNASSTFVLSTPLQVPADGEKTVTIKADIAAITTTNTVATAGHQVTINYYGSTSTSENQGTGQSSGATVANYSSTTSQSAAIIYRSVPTWSKLTLSTYTLSNGTVALYKFRVAADANGDIDVVKFNFDVSTTGTVWLSNLTLVDVTPGQSETTLYASTTAAWGSGGTAYQYPIILRASPGTPSGTITPRTIAKSSYRDFELRGTVSGATTGSGITASVRGDVAALAQTGASYYMASSTWATAQTDSDFVWSDWSDVDHSTSPGTGDTATDWTNGYLVSGLSVANSASEVIAK